MNPEHLHFEQTPPPVRSLSPNLFDAYGYEYSHPSPTEIPLVSNYSTPHHSDNEKDDDDEEEEELNFELISDSEGTLKRVKVQPTTTTMPSSTHQQRLSISPQEKLKSNQRCFSPSPLVLVPKCPRSADGILAALKDIQKQVRMNPHTPVAAVIDMLMELCLEIHPSGTCELSPESAILFEKAEKQVGTKRRSTKNRLIVRKVVNPVTLEEVFNCGECIALNKTEITEYRCREGLILHIKTKHEKDRRWVCHAPRCLKHFVRKSDLRLHMFRLHETKRPYRCALPGCVLSFASSSELKRHLKADHVSMVANLMDPFQSI